MCATQLRQPKRKPTTTKLIIGHSIQQYPIQFSTGFRDCRIHFFPVNVFLRSEQDNYVPSGLPSEEQILGQECQPFRSIEITDQIPIDDSSK
ncbi:hypothetical protein TCAL_16523 [Tigriopus californicus]|uniref:Uncharacterized protein n=1 Tax=Tigriopus californicus TaxID=6832 RepID=A0A553NV07_TIGCA|nr:hypothetical protein TCAL_16523 [Tigriopus californicus]